MGLGTAARKAVALANALHSGADALDRMASASDTLSAAALLPGTILDSPLGLAPGTTWDDVSGGRTNLDPQTGVVTSTTSPTAPGARMRQGGGGGGGGSTVRPRAVSTDSLGNFNTARAGSSGNKAVVTTAPRTERLLERAVSLLERQARGRNDNGASLRREGLLP